MPKLIEWIFSLFSKPPVKEMMTKPDEWITLDQFRAATGLSIDKSREWYEPVKAACLEFEITTPKRIPAFLAQVGHESGGFVYVKEIWGPTAAQKRYEGRSDLGNTQPGDGSKFRGRGLIQITGRYNYEKITLALGIDFVNAPEQLELKLWAARSAAWWWYTHGCNEIADSGDFEKLTKRINGGLNGFSDRKARWEKAKGVLWAI